MQNFVASNDLIQDMYSDDGCQFALWVAKHIRDDDLQTAKLCVALKQVFGFQDLDALNALVNLFASFDQPFSQIRKKAGSTKWTLNDFNPATILPILRSLDSSKFLLDLPWSQLDLLNGKKKFYASSSASSVVGKQKSDSGDPDVNIDKDGSDISVDSSASSAHSSSSSSGSSLTQAADYFAASSLPLFKRGKNKRKRGKHHHRHHRHKNHHSSHSKRNESVKQSSSCKKKQ